LTPNVIPCPYCSSPGRHKFFYGGRNYFHCGRCDLIFSPLAEKDVEASIRHYRDNYHQASASDQLSPERLDIYEKIIDQIEKTQKTGTILDVGCGRGSFLRAAARRGWAAQGIDPSLDSIREAEKNLKGHVFCVTLDDYVTANAYDVVTVINVLDHLPDVRKAMTRAAALLKDGGLLYLRLPNALFHVAMCRFTSTTRILSFLKPFYIFHHYSLTPRFLRRLLHDAGVTAMTIKNAPLAGGYRAPKADASSLPFAVLNKSVYHAARLLEIVSAGRILVGPSFEVFATKQVNRGL